MREACFDADKDGVITHDEFLKGLARTKGQQAATDPFAQAVLQVMDRAGNADGTVGKLRCHQRLVWPNGARTRFDHPVLEHPLAAL